MNGGQAMPEMTELQWVLAIGSAVLVFLPVLVAAVRGHNNGIPILLVTLFLGWTGIGWFVALIWAFTGNTRSAERRRARLYHRR